MGDLLLLYTYSILEMCPLSYQKGELLKLEMAIKMGLGADCCIENNLPNEVRQWVQLYLFGNQTVLFYIIELIGFSLELPASLRQR